jgi:hypothetical protein
MSWYKKEQPTPFDNQPIDGLLFLDGDMLAWEFKQDWTKGQKYPVIVFPSSSKFEFALWASGSEESIGTVHLFGEMDLPLGGNTRDDAFEYAMYVSEMCGYMAEKVGDNQLEVWGHDIGEHLLITYDNEARRMVDVAFVREKKKPPKSPLLDEKSREKLPPLYSNEELGLDAVAQVKFFTPDSNWSWYPSEFDGEDVFFGLVAGHEVELGYFSLSELEAVKGPLGLPIERDRHYQPKTLKELKELHERGEVG